MTLHVTYHYFDKEGVPRITVKSLASSDMRKALKEVQALAWIVPGTITGTEVW